MSKKRRDEKEVVCTDAALDTKAIAKSKAAKARQREYQETCNELQRQYDAACRARDWREQGRIKDNLRFYRLTFQD